jgi:hypothetical protein
MPRVSESDYRSVLEVLREAGAVDGPDPFPEHVLEGLLLWISPGTVRKHLENAYDKLGVHTRTGAVAALVCARSADRLGGRSAELGQPPLE